MSINYHQVTGAGGLDKLELTSTDGSRAEVYLYGAHLTSWVPAGEQERVYLSPMAEFRPGVSIRGGIPVCFPQFSSMGLLPKHGFARTSFWSLDSVQVQEKLAARLYLADSDETRQLWPYAFRCE